MWAFFYVLFLLKFGIFKSIRLLFEVIWTYIIEMMCNHNLVILEFKALKYIRFN